MPAQSGSVASRETESLVAGAPAAGGAQRPLRQPRVKTAIGIVLAIMVVVWEAIVRLGLVSDRFVASPTQIVEASAVVLQDSGPRQALLDAIGMFFVAFAIASVVGVLAGAGMGLSRVLFRVFHPFILALFSTPKMIFIPIFVLVTGFGTTSKISYAAVSAFFPVAVTVTAGVRMVDKRLLLAADSMGASRVQRFHSILLPGSLPSVMAGLWFGMKHALLGVLVMELFASQKGVGYYISTYSSAGRTDRVFAIVFMMALFAMLLGSLWRTQEKRLGRWRTPS